MRSLLLFLCLLPSWASAVWAPGSLFVFFRNTTDTDLVNGYVLTLNGTVATNTTPCIPNGTHNRGIFSDANYYAADATLEAAMSDKSSFTIQYDLYVAAGVDPIPWSTNDGAVEYMIFNTVTDQMGWVTSGGTVLSGFGDFTELQCATWRFTFDGTTKRIWKMVEGATAFTQVGSGAHAAALGTVTEFRIGQDTDTSNSLNGYISNVRFWTNSDPGNDPAGEGDCYWDWEPCD